MYMIWLVWAVRWPRQIEKFEKNGIFPDIIEVSYNIHWTQITGSRKYLV